MFPRLDWQPMMNEQPEASGPEARSHAERRTSACLDVTPAMVTITRSNATVVNASLSPAGCAARSVARPVELGTLLPLLFSSPIVAGTSGLSFFLNCYWLVTGLSRDCIVSK